jgi:hypothetical protein
MNRRSFFTALAALPFIPDALKKMAEPESTTIEMRVVTGIGSPEFTEAMLSYDRVMEQHDKQLASAFVEKIQADFGELDIIKQPNE